jgi:hypothetical protein
MVQQEITVLSGFFLPGIPGTCHKTLRCRPFHQHRKRRRIITYLPIPCGQEQKNGQFIPGT